MRVIIMRIKDGYVLKVVAGQNIVIPIKEEGVNFKGIITLNGSGKLLFDSLLRGAAVNDLIELLFDNYDMEREDARRDVLEFIKVLKEKKLLAE